MTEKKLMYKAEACGWRPFKVQSPKQDPDQKKTNEQLNPGARGT